MINEFNMLLKDKNIVIAGSGRESENISHFCARKREPILDYHLEHLQEKAPKTFNNVKDLKKFIEFLLVLNKK